MSSLAPTRQPHPNADGNRNLPSVHRAADRVGRPGHPRIFGGVSAKNFLPGPDGILRCAATGKNGPSPAGGPFRPCRCCIRPICCANPRKRNWRGATFEFEDQGERVGADKSAIVSALPVSGNPHQHQAGGNHARACQSARFQRFLKPEHGQHHGEQNAAFAQGSHKRHRRAGHRP